MMLPLGAQLPFLRLQQQFATRNNAATHKGLPRHSGAALS
jgi:hypothetical protein